MFLMQPIGQILAALVPLVVTYAFKNFTNVSSTKTLDQVWRIVVGVGALPTLFAMIF
jgi:hypothetical protein